MTHLFSPHASALLRVAVVVLALLAPACGGRRILGFGGGRDGILVVRHTQAGPLEITAGDEVLGFAEPGGIACFRQVPTGSIRFEARRVGGRDLVRAHTIVLPPEQPLLWDVDHNQVLNGRAHAEGCA